jgi:hypothetical protein
LSEGFLKNKRQTNMRMQQQQWINEVISSLEGLQKTEGNPYMHTRVLARLENDVQAKKVSFKTVYALASVVLLVLLLNVFFWNQSGTDSIDNSTVTTTTAQEYDLTSIDY